MRPASAPGLQPGTAWEFRAGNYIGVFRCGDLNIVIRPRIPIDRVMLMVGYSLNSGDWDSSPLRLSPQDDILEAIVPAFVRLTQHAIRRGLLQGYRTREESSTALQGRIRLADQVKVRFGLPLPVEVVYDEFTEDIEENRLLKTAIGLLWQTPVSSRESRRDLGALRPAFTSVSSGSYRPGMVPSVSYTRLNQRYRPGSGTGPADHRQLAGGVFPGRQVGHPRSWWTWTRCLRAFCALLCARPCNSPNQNGLTGPQPLVPCTWRRSGQLQVHPGLSWWRGRRCLFVGEARYALPAGGPGTADTQQADIYRMLAYCAAADLPRACCLRQRRVAGLGGASHPEHRKGNRGRLD